MVEHCTRTLIIQRTYICIARYVHIDTSIWCQFTQLHQLYVFDFSSCYLMILTVAVVVVDSAAVAATVDCVGMTASMTIQSLFFFMISKYLFARNHFFSAHFSVCLSFPRVLILFPFIYLIYFLLALLCTRFILLPCAQLFGGQLINPLIFSLTYTQMIICDMTASHFCQLFANELFWFCCCCCALCVCVCIFMYLYTSSYQYYLEYDPVRQMNEIVKVNASCHWFLYYFDY